MSNLPSPREMVIVGERCSGKTTAIVDRIVGRCHDPKYSAIVLVGGRGEGSHLADALAARLPSGAKRILSTERFIFPSGARVEIGRIDDWDRFRGMRAKDLIVSADLQFSYSQFLRLRMRLIDPMESWLLVAFERGFIPKWAISWLCLGVAPSEDDIGEAA